MSPRHLAVAFVREAGRFNRTGWCLVCKDVLSVAGVGISLMGGDQMGTLGVSDSRVAALEDSQYTLGVGPSLVAFAERRGVEVPYLDDAAAASWPVFVDMAAAKGFAAVFAFPIESVGARLGVLSLYNDEAGELTARQRVDVLALCELLADALRSVDSLDGGVRPVDLDLAIAYRAEIFQASGMVSVQLKISVSEALIRIRAYSFASGRSVAVVAADIVARRLRLDDDQHSEEGA
ncbi:MAG: hypothetical protein WCI22_03700 [Actinomycetota bacterium]